MLSELSITASNRLLLPTERKWRQFYNTIRQFYIIQSNYLIYQMLEYMSAVQLVNKHSHSRWMDNDNYYRIKLNLMQTAQPTQTLVTLKEVHNEPVTSLDSPFPGISWIQHPATMTAPSQLNSNHTKLPHVKLNTFFFFFCNIIHTVCSTKVIKWWSHTKLEFVNAYLG